MTMARTFTPPDGWLTIAHADLSALQMTPRPVAGPLQQFPPPRRAELTLSAKRDASTVRATFSGIIPRSQFSETMSLKYGNDHMWYVGASEVKYRLDEGEPVTEIVFRLGPYRQASRTKYNASYYLYEQLAVQFPELIINASIFNSPRAASFTFSESSEVALWRFIMSGATDAMTHSQTATEILRIMDLSVFAGYLQYDDVVRRLFERWMFMTWIKPDYLNNVPAALLFGSQAAREMIPPPELTMRNCLDNISLYYGPTMARPNLPELPEVRDISMEWDVDAQKREEEDTMLRFWMNTIAVPSRDLINGFVPTLFQWRFSNAWFDRIRTTIPGVRGGIGVEDDFFDPPGTVSMPPKPPAANPWTLWSSYALPSINHADLECRLLQQENFFPNRMRRVTIPAPDTAAEVMNLVPGSAVKLSRNGEAYWITEMKLSTPPLTMTLDLVFPPPHDGRAWDADLPDGSLAITPAAPGLPAPTPTPAPAPPGGGGGGGGGVII